MNIINKFQTEYKQEAGGKRFYTPKQYVGQFRRINKDAKKLYETQLLQGKSLDTIGFYEELKGEISKTLEHGTPPEFSALFKETNSQYAELAKLDKFENFMGNITKDGLIDSTKLQNVMRSPTKSKALQRQIGKEGYSRLRLISQDLAKTQDKIHLIEDFGLTEMVKSGAVTKLLSKLGLKGLLPVQAGKKASEVAYGYFLLSPKGSRDFSNLLKAVQSGSKKSIETYLKRLDKNALEHESNEDSEYLD